MRAIDSPNWSDPSPEAYAQGFAREHGWRFEAGSTARCGQAWVDDLIEEVPVALVFGDEPAIVMMATPLDAEDFARGFAITEGIVDRAGQITSIDAVPANGGLAVFIGLEAGLQKGLAARVAARRRAGATAGGCGLCGVGDVAHALRAPRPVPMASRFTAGAIGRAFEALPAHQTVGARTGSAHGAAFADANGRILAFAEDAGRHNALDKLIGRVARLGLDPAAGFAAVTSRASFEMAQKAAMAGFPMLCAISAPTALAVRLARECELTLCAFARAGRFSCFSAPQRLVR